MRAIIQLVLALTILAGGSLTAIYLFKSKPPPMQRKIGILAPLVQTQSVKRSDVDIVITGNGTVRAKSIVTVTPEVSGKIIKVAPEMVNGGFFEAHQILITIDPRDYELAVQKTAAAVERTKVKLEQETAEADVVRKEWRQMRPGEEPTSPLVFREPQIRQARAELQAALADLDVAKLKLERTEISLPFNGRIITETVEEGQFLAIGKYIAEVYATDKVEIPVPLENAQLAWFDAPLNSPNSDESAKDAVVDIFADFAGQRRQWTGTVVRTEARIDNRSRMVYVIVEVNNPFEIKGDRIPLTPGMYVNVEIAGNILKNVFTVPGGALHNENKLWVIDNGSLKFVSVDITLRQRENVYVSAGLDDNQVIVTSSLDVVVEGMKVRTEKNGADERSQAPEGADRKNIQKEADSSD